MLLGCIFQRPLLYLVDPAAAVARNLDWSNHPVSELSAIAIKLSASPS